MKQYETGFLISPNLSEEELDQLILKMAEVVTKKKGKMLKEDRWGKRKLAYPINKSEEAFYTFFHYEGEPDVPSELERRFKQSDAILRYLTVRKERRENIRKKKKIVGAEEEKAIEPQKGEIESQEEKIEDVALKEEEFSPEETEAEEK